MNTTSSDAFFATYWKFLHNDHTKVADTDHTKVADTESFVHAFDSGWAKKVVLIIDEFDMLLEQRVSGETRSNILSAFRGLKHNDNCLQVGGGHFSLD